MSYLIIFFVIALALAPLSHFLPSKAQRKVARIREYAALQGLFVEFRALPTRQGSTVSQKTGNTIYYGKRVRARGLGPKKRISWMWGPDGWIGIPRRQPVPAQLSSLPEGILAASADPESCGIYWQETGGEPEIDQLCVVLEALAESLYQ